LHRNIARLQLGTFLLCYQQLIIREPGNAPGSSAHEADGLLIAYSRAEIFIESSCPIWNPNGKFLEIATASNTGDLIDLQEIVCRLYMSALQFAFRVLMFGS